jgi:hypothetical protein
MNPRQIMLHASVLLWRSFADFAVQEWLAVCFTNAIAGILVETI